MALPGGVSISEFRVEEILRGPDLYITSSFPFVTLNLPREKEKLINNLEYLLTKLEEGEGGDKEYPINKYVHSSSPSSSWRDSSTSMKLKDYKQWLDQHQRGSSNNSTDSNSSSSSNNYSSNSNTNQLLCMESIPLPPLIASDIDLERFGRGIPRDKGKFFSIIPIPSSSSSSSSSFPSPNGLR